MSAEDLNKYTLLLMKNKTMKSEAKKKICTLETELNNANGIVKYANDHLQQCIKKLSVETDIRLQREKELKSLHSELEKTKEIIKSNEKLFEEEMNKILSNKSIFTCNQLEDFNVKIYKLTGDLKKSTEALQICEKKNQEYVNALNEEKTKSEEKDRDLTKFANQLNYIYLELNNTYSQLKSAKERNSKLESELKSNEALTDRLNEVEKELIDVKHCLSEKTNEVECKSRELHENQLNRDNIKIINDLEAKIISGEEKLRKCEDIKIFYENNCKVLTEENDLIKNEYSVLVKNVEQLNNSVASACEKENYWRKNSEMCATKLKASIEEIQILSIEIKCVKDKLYNMEKTLRNTELKLTEETSQKEIFRESYNNMVSKCNHLDKLESLAVQNDVQINNQKLELVALSNENQKITDMNNALCNRLEVLETTISKDNANEKEILKQLHETMQQLCQGEQNRLNNREKEIKSNATTEFSSRRKILKFQKKTFEKIIKKNVEQYKSVNDVMSEQLNYLKRQSDERENKSHQMAEELPGYTEQPNDSQSRDGVMTPNEKTADTPRVERPSAADARDRVASDSSDRLTRCSASEEAGSEAKSPSSRHGSAHTARSVVTPVPGCGLADVEPKKSRSASGRHVKGSGPPSDRPRVRTDVAERATERSRGQISDDRNAVIIAKLKRQLDKRIGMHLR